MVTRECHYCENSAAYQCPTCGRLYCADHGDDVCLRCMAPESAMPSAWTYRGSLLALAAGAAVTVYLLVSPPEARQSAVAARPSVTPTSTPSPAPGTGTPGPRSPTASAGTVVTTPTAISTATPAVRTYTVQPGDVLSVIAARFDTTVDAILNVNPGLEADRLTPGQVITIPGGP